jgi:RING finger protein 170
MFCGECITAYWRYGDWLGAINCAVCRAAVTILLVSFQEADLEDPSRERILEEVREYNSRFSGEPRPLLDYIRDIPVLLPHLAAQFFSLTGIIAMFRLRVLMCVTVAFIYILSPLDILPEAIFGIVGMLDDAFVVLMFAMYISLAYRQFIAGGNNR